MPLLYILFWIIVIGLLVWLAVTYIPMPDPLKKLLVAVAVIGIILWLISIWIPFGGGPVIGPPPYRH